MKIRLAVTQDENSWDTYVDSRLDAAPYCRFAWKTAVEQAYGHKAYYLLAEKNGVTKGVLPLINIQIPFCGNSLVSLPFCDVGDVLADNADIKKGLLAELMILRKRLKVKNIDLRSCQKGLLGEDNPGRTVNVQTSKVHMLLSLPDSSEKLWDGFKSKLRSQIRKAQKNGLTFRWGSTVDLPSFYQVFSRNMHDLGSPVHSQLWIEKVFVHYGENAKMGLVFKDDQPIGCGMILFTNHQVSVPWASTLREFNRLSPNMMLYWNFLKFASDHEKKIFDFGRSTLNEGTYRFKKQWGAVPEQLYWYCLNMEYSKDSSSSGRSRELLEQIWQKMPLAVANYIGPKVRKYISL